MAQKWLIGHFARSSKRRFDEGMTEIYLPKMVNTYSPIVNNRLANFRAYCLDPATITRKTEDTILGLADKHE